MSNLFNVNAKLSYTMISFFHYFVIIDDEVEYESCFCFSSIFFTFFYILFFVNVRFLLLIPCYAERAFSFYSPSTTLSLFFQMIGKRIGKITTHVSTECTRRVIWNWAFSLFPLVLLLLLLIFTVRSSAIT